MVAYWVWEEYLVLCRVLEWLGHLLWGFCCCKDINSVWNLQYVLSLRPILSVLVGYILFCADAWCPTYNMNTWYYVLCCYVLCWFLGHTACILCFMLGYTCIVCLCWVFWRVLTFLCMESQASVISRFVVFPRTSCPYWVWRVYSNLLLMSSVIWRSHKNIIDQIPQIISYTAFSYFTERTSDIWNQAPQIISYTAFFFTS